jgi:hypothetical protein
MPGGRGEGGARGRGLISCAPGRSGHHVCRHYDRHARCVAGSGEIVGGVTPAPWTVCPRNLARIAPRDHTPLGKSRGEPEGELSPKGQRRTPRGGGRPCVFRRSISFLFLAKRKKRKETPRPATPRGSFCSRFALHVTEIGCPAGKGACGNGRALHSLLPAGGEKERASRERWCLSVPTKVVDGASGMELRCRCRRSFGY